MRPSIEYLPYTPGTACEKCGCAYSAHDSDYVHGPCHGVQVHDTKPGDGAPFWSATYDRWVTLCRCTSFRACPDFEKQPTPANPEPRDLQIVHGQMP